MDIKYNVVSRNTIVVGTGAAAYNAADRLYNYGQKDIAIATDHINAGTSRNTGSDKQTYYKLTLSGEEPDSVVELAKTLYAGGCVDGDIALAEAALSAMSFLKLCDLGVPFPVNRYGEFIGYKTDHDPRRRATSVGPYTSKMMTECLEKAVMDKNIEIFDGCQVVKVLVDNGEICGLVCLNIKETDVSFTVFNCKNVIYATGGPAGMYADSVFPFGHYGATGLAFEAGAMGKNLTEWQFGLASIKPRWNVSGTYMQVLPKFVSTDKDGNDEHEFLNDFFTDKGDMLTKVFLKGYQWPFDCRKVDGGSSIVDILVYIELYLKGRRVFLDFRANPSDEDIDYSSMSDEARIYLEKATATFGTPIERLLHMNTPAVDFYMDKGVDLRTEPLEISLCAQHNNGGLSIDKWWQTNINGFFCVGEASGSHGVYRPGGSALNAGQVGSTRAAQYVANVRTGDAVSTDEFLSKVETQIKDVMNEIQNISCDESNVNELFTLASEDMSKVGGAIRNKDYMHDLALKIKEKIETFDNTVKTKTVTNVAKAYRYKDALISQYVYLNAMINYMEHGGESRGSALYYNKDGKKPYDVLPDVFTYKLDDEELMKSIQEVVYKDNKCEFSWRDIRPIPTEDDFFENVWKNYRENKNVY